MIEFNWFNFLSGFCLGAALYCCFLIVLDHVFIRTHEKKAPPKRRAKMEPNKIHQPGPAKRKARAVTDSELWDRERGS
jgi:hypothetical protein